MGGLERLPDNVGFVPNLSFNVENLPSIVYGTLACICKPVYAYTCMKLAYVELELVYTYTCLCTHALGFLDLNFLKIDLFSS